MVWYSNFVPGLIFALMESARSWKEGSPCSRAEAYRLMFQVRQRDAEARDPALQEAAERARATMSYHVKRLVEADVLEGDAELVGYVFWAALHGLVMLELSGNFPKGYSFAKVRSEAFRALWHGFLKRA